MMSRKSIGIGMTLGIGAFVAIGMLATTGQYVPGGPGVAGPAGGGTANQGAKWLAANQITTANFDDDGMTWSIPHGGTAIQCTEATGACTWAGVQVYTANQQINVSTADNATANIDFISRNGEWAIGQDVANATVARDQVIAAKYATYSFEDGATNSNTTLTSAAQGNFSQALVGLAISGAGIPGATTIASVQSATSLTLSQAASATATGVRVTVGTGLGSIQDFLYVRHRGGLTPTLGVGPGATPPLNTFRMSVATESAAGTDENAMGGLAILSAAALTGDVLAFTDASGSHLVYFDHNFVLNGGDRVTNSPLAINLNGNSRYTAFVNGASVSGFTGSSGDVTFRDITNGIDQLTFAAGGGVKVLQGLNLSNGTKHIRSTGTAVVPSSCGNSPTVNGSTDVAGAITIGATGTGCTVPFGATFTNKPSCVVSFEQSITWSYTVSATQLVVTAAAGAGDTFHYHCDGLI